jgi:hypothetical protein
MAATKAPTKKIKGGGTAQRDLNSTAHEDQWHLSAYIDVADSLTLLPAGWKDGIHAVLREFRNYVHPRLELVTKDEITEGEAFLAFATLMCLVEHIRKNHP